MDKLDSKILLELTKNSRIAFTVLAKKLRTSREVLNYRIDRLKEKKIILNFVTEIDVERLGYVAAAVFINIRIEKEKEFKDFLERCGFVSWVAELSGVWNFGLSIYGGNNNELDEKFNLIYNKFKESINDHRFTLHKNSSFFYEKYFDGKYEFKLNKENYNVDDKDKIILKKLSKNSRISVVDLATNLKLSAPAVIKRIKNLEKSGYILKYSIFVDLSKLNFYQYSVFIRNNIENKTKLNSYLSNHKNISFIAEYIGDNFLEFGIVVNNPYDLRVILRDIEESFPDNRIIEVSLFQKEFLSVGSPRIVFE
jgi:DNA-binding Lrp family transcriptional regulator